MIFKFGLQYVSLTNCSNQILFQYSYDNGIQWHTKIVLDETTNVFERFDDIPLNTNIHLRWIEENGNRSCFLLRIILKFGFCLYKRLFMFNVESTFD